MAVSRLRLGAVLGINQTLSWGMTFYLPAVIAQPVEASLGQSAFRILGAFSWGLLVAGFCAPRVGRWIDQHGGRGSLLLSIVIMATGQIMLAASPNLAIWFLAWTVIGVGMAMGLYDAAFATAGGILQEEAGPAITGITLVAGFASTVFWTLGSSLVGATGWRGLLLIYAGIMVVVNLPMVWALVPHAPPRARPRDSADAASDPSRRRHSAMVLLGGFFALRWFITSVIAVNILVLFQGIGLTAGEAVLVASIIGPGQVAGRVLEWIIGPRVGVLMKARLAAALFPAASLLLLIGSPIATAAFAVLYGMSNGIMTINRGTLPLALFGPRGYAQTLGWLAMPVLLAQATAPTLAAPLVQAFSALNVLMLCGFGAAVALLFLLPLRLQRP